MKIGLNLSLCNIKTFNGGFRINYIGSGGVNFSGNANIINLIASMLAAYPLNGNGLDATDNGWDLVDTDVANPVGYVGGKIGQSAAFNIVGANLKSDTPGICFGLTTFSVCGWVYLKTYNRTCFLGEGVGYGSGYAWQVGTSYADPTKFNFYIGQTANDWRNVISTDNIPLDEWVFVYAHFIGGLGAFAAFGTDALTDATLESNTSASGVMPDYVFNAGGIIELGGWNSIAEQAIARLDSFYVFDRPLTELEREYLYTAPEIFPSSFTPSEFFVNGEVGNWWDFSNISTRFVDNTPATQANEGDTVGRLEGQVANSLNWIQSSISSRPILTNNVGDFDGTGSNMILNPGIASPFTIAFSLFIPSDYVNGERLLSHSDGTSFSIGLNAQNNGTGLDIWTNTWKEDVIPAANLITGEWSRIIITFNGSIVTGYCNGVVQTPVDFTGFNTPSLNCLLGWGAILSGAFGNYFDGQFKQMLMIDRVLDSGEIAQLDEYFTYTEQAQLQNSVVAWYPFESNGNDSGPNGLDLSANNSPTFIPGKVGDATHLVAASTQTFDVADANDGPFDFQDTSFFVSFWARLTNISHSVAFVCKYTAGDPRWLCYYEQNTSAKICWYINGSRRVSTTFAPTVDVWTHYIFEHDADADEARIWIDNIYYPTGDQAVVGGIGGPSSIALEVGSWGNHTGDLMDGDMDSLGIFNGISTSTQRDYLYNSGLGRDLYNSNLYNPANDAPLVWLDAELSTLYSDLGTTPVVANDSLVRRISDISGNGNHFDAPADGNRATIKTNILNGLPILRFSTDDCYSAASLGIGTFAIISIWSSSGSVIVYEHGPNTNTNDGFYFSPDNSYLTLINNTGYSSNIYGSNVNDSTWRVVTHETTGTHASHKVRYNGVEQTISSSPNVDNTGSGVITDTLYLGSRGNIQHFANMDFLGIVVFNSHPGQEVIERVENYYLNRTAI